MDKQGFINYTSSFSPAGPGKAGNYAKAIDILNDIFSNVSIKDYPAHNIPKGWVKYSADFHIRNNVLSLFFYLRKSFCINYTT